MSKMIKSRFVQSERPAIAELLSRNLSGVNDFRFFFRQTRYIWTKKTQYRPTDEYCQTFLKLYMMLPSC